MANEPLQFGTYYHIYNRGNNREKLFIEQRNYPYFLKLYAKYILPVADTFAYCLMSNHFHFGIRTYTEEEQEAYWAQQRQLANEQGPPIRSRPPFPAPVSPIFKLKEPSRAFNNMFIAYTRAFNKATERTGALFERPFHRKLVEDDVYRRQLVVYIHQNPQHHGFVKDFRAWSWSSYSAYHSTKPSAIQRKTVIDWFGGIEMFDARHLDIVKKEPVEFEFE